VKPANPERILTESEYHLGECLRLLGAIELQIQSLNDSFRKNLLDKAMAAREEIK
jgi:hypothetical protein